MKRKLLIVCVLIIMVLSGCKRVQTQEATEEKDVEYELQVREKHEKEEFKANCAREETEIQRQSLDNLHRFDKEDVADVFVGKNRLFLKTKNGELYGWGEAFLKENPCEYTKSQVKNADIDLFLCSSENIQKDKICGRGFMPSPFKMNIGFVPKDIISRDNGVMALSENGEIYLWGDQEKNMGFGINYKKPLKFENVKAEKIYDILGTLYYIDEKGYLHGNETQYGENSMHYDMGTERLKGENEEYFKNVKIKEIIYSEYELIARTYDDEFLYIDVYGGKVDNRYKRMNINEDKNIKKLISDGKELFALYNNGEVYNIKRTKINLGYDYTLEKINIDDEKFSEIYVSKDGKFFITEKREVYVASISSGDSTKNNFSKIKFPEKIVKAKVFDFNQVFWGESGNIYVSGDNISGQKLDGTRISSPLGNKITK